MSSRKKFKTEKGVVINVVLRDDLTEEQATSLALLLKLYEVTKEMPRDDLLSLECKLRELGTDHEDGAPADNFVVDCVTNAMELWEASRSAT